MSKDLLEASVLLWHVSFLMFTDKAIFVTGYGISNPNVTKNQLCLTEACIETSNRLYKSMDRSVNPCQNFNKFVCGRFIKESLIPEREPLVDLTSTLLEDIMYERGQKLMETEYETEEFETDKKLKNFYTTCSQVAQREIAGLKPLLEILEKIGGWPVLENIGIIVLSRQFCDYKNRKNRFSYLQSENLDDR